MENVIERFLRYVRIDTQSSECSDTFPSTEKQKKLGNMLSIELKELGVEDVFFDERYGYVYASIPATKGCEDRLVIAFIAHMDTSPETSGENVQPKIVENYDGNDITLDDEGKYILSSKTYPELLKYLGKTLITTDGSTLLGADDKAGIAEIMSMAEVLLTDDSIMHGRVVICFTPDEEVGAGVDYIDMDKLGADYAYTVDGGGIGELEFENFNAASLSVKIHGVTVHPGEAKNKMKNAMRIAMEYDRMLPEHQRPEYTEGYEGFYHLCDMAGDVEEATLDYIVRDHSRELFEAKKKLAMNIAGVLNDKYGENTVEILLKDSYYNMREKIEPDNMFLIDIAKEAMLELEIEPIVTPIRGGTDGARLSFMGLPCPNICTGGHNYHGRYEYVCADSMIKITQLLIKILNKIS